MTPVPEGHYTAMAMLCGAKVMNMFGTRMFIVHWPDLFIVHWPDLGKNGEMNPLYGYGDTLEDAAYNFLERNGLLPP